MNSMIFLPPELLIEIISNMSFEEISLICQSSKDLNNICQSLAFKNMIIFRLNDTFDLSDFSYTTLLFYAKVFKIKNKMSVWMKRDDYHVVQQILNINTNHSYKLINNKLEKLPPMGIDPDDKDLFHMHVNYITYNKELSFLQNNKLIKEGKSKSHKIITVGKYNITTLTPTDVILTNGGEIYTGEYLYFIDDEKAIDISLVSKDKISIISSQGKCYVLSFEMLSGPVLILYTGLNYIIQHIIIDQTHLFLTVQGDVYTTQYHPTYTYTNYNKDYIRETKYADIIGSYNNKYFSKNQAPIYYYKLELPKVIQMTSNGHLLTENGSVYKIDEQNHITVELISSSNQIKKIFPYFNDYVYIDEDHNLFDSDLNQLDFKNVIEVISGNDELYILDDQKINIYDPEEETLKSLTLK